MEENASNVEENPPKTGKYSLNYGLILGGIGVAFGIMLFLQDAHTSQSPGVMAVGILLTAGVIFWGIYNFRKANGGYLTLGQALKLGAGIALIAGIVSVLFNIILVNYLDPDAPSKIMDARLAEPLANGDITAAQAEQQKEMSLQYWWMGYPVIVIVNVLIGLVIGLIAGLIFKKPKPAY